MDNGSDKFFPDSIHLKFKNSTQSYKYGQGISLEMATKFFHDKVREKWNYVILYRVTPSNLYNKGYWVEYRPYQPYKIECEPNTIMKYDISENRNLLIEKILD